MKQKITIRFIIALLFAVSVQIQAAEVTIRFKAPVGWTNVYFYIWGTNNSLIGNWPGTAVALNSDGFYTFTYDNTGISIANGIFNNNAGQQTVSFDVLATSCWEATTITGTEYNVARINCPDAVPVPVNVGFKAPEGWTDVYFYIWGTDNSLVGPWPGTKLSADADGFYRGTFDKAGITEANGVFNNNAGEQTGSIDVLGGGCWEAGELTGSEYATVAITCPSSTGVGIVKKESVTFFPNPTSGIISFSSNLSIEKVTLYNSLGKEMRLVTLTENKLDLSVYPAGIYLVSINTKDGKLINKNVIKL
jgi:hypothetical protein